MLGLRSGSDSIVLRLLLSPHVVMDDGNGDNVSHEGEKSSETKKKRERKTKARRKRLIRPKQRGLYKPESRLPKRPGHGYVSPAMSFDETDMINDSTKADSRGNVSIQESVNVEVGNEYGENPCLEETLSSPPEAIEPAVQSSVENPSLQAIAQVLKSLKNGLSERWALTTDRAGIHLLLLSASNIKSVQREIFVTFDGSVSFRVHCTELPANSDIVKQCPSPVPLYEDNINLFCERALSFSQLMMQFQVCSGGNHNESKELWSTMPDTYIDLNPYLEPTYDVSCRSTSCSRLIPIGKSFLRCSACSKVIKLLKERLKFAQKTEISKTVPNMYLSQQQAQAKLKQQHEEIRKKDKRLSYLESQIETLLKDEGVDLEEDLSNDFQSILEKANLNSFQRVFLEQQLSASAKSDSRSHRWHPTLIRLAIQIKSISSSAYEALRESGAIRMPCDRTLYDYTHFIEAQDGLNKGILQIISTRVCAMKNSYQHFHALLIDEMHVSQNLVYRKGDGALVGYVHLDEVEKEMDKFESFLAGKSDADRPLPLATSMLTFMVKGLTSDVKSAVASYPTKVLSKEVLYTRTWNVISELEGAGVKVLSIVCDGHPVYRAFMKLHTPMTVTESGIVFDTLNFCSEEIRPLFFISDAAHLIKTLRNCLYNSREGGKGHRCLMINEEYLVWNTIIRLYLKYKTDTLRKSFKLHAQNVFLNSYSQMNVKYAAQIFSNTVANDIEQENWPGTKELVTMLRNGNKFFDCLNGAFSSQATRTRNPHSAPYKDINDERFHWLQSYLKYLGEWKEQSEKRLLPAKDRHKTFISRETYEGTEIAIKGFTAATKFLLSNLHAKFVMARVFSQDPLEQHFSRQRQSGGGSTNPNVQQFQRNMVKIAVQGQVRTRRRKANVEDDLAPSDVSDASLPKLTKRKK